MSNRFNGEGNLGADPTMGTNSTGDHKNDVCNMSIYFDNRVPNKAGEYEDKGGFWRNVEIWGNKATLCMEHLKKGYRVCVDGRQYEQQWTEEKDGEKVDRSQIRVRAENIYLSLYSVSNIKSNNQSQ